MARKWDIYLEKSVPLIDKLVKLRQAGKKESGFYSGYMTLQIGLKDIIEMLEDKNYKLTIKRKEKHESK